MRVLVGRALPFGAIILVLGVQVLAKADPVVAFPFYLAVVLGASLRLQRLESIFVAATAAVASLVWPLLNPPELVAALLLAVVLLTVAVVMGEVTRTSRQAVSAAQRMLSDLEASDRRMRAMLESADVGLALAAFDGAWLQVNDPLAAILGRSREKLMRTTLVEVTGERDKGSVEGALTMLRNGDFMRWEGDVRQLRPDGSAVDVALFLARLPNPAVGEPCVLVQLIDISRRVHADALLDCIAATRQVIATAATPDLAMPQLLQAFCGYLDWSVGQHWTVDPGGQAMVVRHAWNANGTILEGFLHASRGTAAARGVGLIGRVWKSGVLAAEEDVERAADYDRLTPARTAGLRSAVAFPVVDAGEVTGVIELVSDRLRRPQNDEVTMLAASGVEIGQFMRRSETSTALRQSEADHRAIYERSPIGIARIGGGGDLVEANPALLHMLSHDEDTMRVTAWPDLLRAYDQAAARLHKPSFLAGVSDGSSVQVRAATGAGNWLWLQLTASAIPDSNGRPEHVLVLIEDVTAVRETSDKLTEALEAQREANANLEKIDRTKSEFLSIVSHEFRTALTGIQGFSELIRDGGLEPDEVRAYGGYIFNDAERVNRLIGDMLDLDRMESGRMTMRTMDVDINDILMEAISRTAPSAVTVEFKSDLDPRLPIVAGDRDRLIQVVGNLVNNAVKYSPEGGTITLSSRVDGRFALVSVTDTGIGIPQEEIGHVFERFRRVRSGAAQSIPGTGLGLTIVKQIVELHGGKIWVESAVGHGSSFHFTIPLAPEGAKALQLRHA